MSSKVDRKMSDFAVNWKDEIGAIAGPFLPTDTKDSWLGRAHDAVSKINDKISFRHLRDLYQGYVTDPKHSVAVSVLSAAEQARIEEARRDARKVADFLNRHAQALANVDENFHRPEIDACIETARIIGGGDRT